MRFPPGQELQGVITSHGPFRESYRSSRKSRGSAEAFSTPAAQAVRLLKGCEQRFHPRQARQRYCSDGCRKAARKWSRWKAQERYRESAAGQHKRNDQSRRYRERVKDRKPAEPEAVSDAARVITTEHSFRPLLRPARLLREIRASKAKSLAALLLAQVPGAHWSASENGSDVGKKRAT